MKQTYLMTDEDGAEYDIPQEHLESFRQTFPKASATTSYRTDNGEKYDIPQGHDEAFRQTFANAQPMRRYSFADGTTRSFTTPELAKFLGTEYRTDERFARDRDEDAAATGKAMAAWTAQRDAAQAAVPPELQPRGALHGAAQGALAGAKSALGNIAAALPEAAASIAEAGGNALEAGSAPGSLGDAFGSWLRNSGRGLKRWLGENVKGDVYDENGARVMSGLEADLGYMDDLAKVGEIAGDAAGMAVKFAPAAVAGPGYIEAILASDGINAYRDTYDSARERGWGAAEANVAGATAGLINYFGGKMLMKSGEIAGDWAKGVLGRFLASGGVASGAMAAQAAGNRGVQNVLEGRPLTEGIGRDAANAAVEGGMFHVMNAAAHGAKGAVAARKETSAMMDMRKSNLLAVAEAEGGGGFLDRVMRSNGMEAAIEARKSGMDVSRKMGKAADLPDNMNAEERNAVVDAIVRNRAAQQQQQQPEAQPAPAAAPELPAHENRLRRQQPNFRHRGQGEEPLPAEEPVQTEQQTTESIQEKTNETGNVPVETQPQPPAQDAGRDGRQPPPQAEPRPVEAQPQGSEVPAAGQIEAQPEAQPASNRLRRADGTDPLEPAPRKTVGKGDSRHGMGRYSRYEYDRDAANSGSSGALVWHEDNGGRIYSIPVDYERTVPGGRVVLSRDDSAYDRLREILDGRDLRMSKSGKLYFKDGKGVPNDLRDLLGKEMKIGRNPDEPPSVARMSAGDGWEAESGRDYGRTWEDVERDVATDRENYNRWKQGVRRDFSRSTEAKRMEKDVQDGKAAQSDLDARRLEWDMEDYLDHGGSRENPEYREMERDLERLQESGATDYGRIAEERDAADREMAKAPAQPRTGNAGESHAPERTDGFQLESATPQQIAAEEARRREQAEIKRRQEAPLKGSGAVNVQPEMDLDQTGQQDLFSPIAEKPENASVSALKKTEATMPPKAAKPAEGGKSVSGADKVDDAHETNVARAAEIIAEQARKNTKDESITADNVRRGAESLVTAIENRDANALRSRFNGLNKGSVKAFEAITGLKMPSTQKGQHEAVDRFCGISPEERTRIDAAREAEAKAVKEARRKEQSLRDGENAASRFKVKLKDGKVTTAKELVGERGWQVRVGKRGAVNETWIIDPKTGMGVKVKSEMREYLTSLMQKPVTSTETDYQNWLKRFNLPDTKIRRENWFNQLSKDESVRSDALDYVRTMERWNGEDFGFPVSGSTTPPAKPAFKRGDRVFLKGAADGQRVTFVKANADGTADVQVRTPGANRYMPEKVETRTVPIGDVSGGGMKDTLTDVERSAYRRGMAEQQRDSMRDDPILQRIDAAYRTAKTDAERSALKAQFVDRARQLQSAAGLDPSEARASRGNAQDVPAKWTDTARKPLERVAHALRNAVTVGGNRLKVSFADRPADVDVQTRKSIGGVFTGSAADYANRSRQGGVDDGPSVKHIGTGEGSQVYGWGLYGSTVRGVAEGYAGLASNGEAERWTIPGAEVKKFSKGQQDALQALERFRNKYEAINRLIDIRRDKSKDNVKRARAANALKSIKEDGWIPQGSQIYEQTFFTNRAEGDESHLLKWYEPVSEENANRILDRLAVEFGSDRAPSGAVSSRDYPLVYANGERASGFWTSRTGEQVYNELSNTLGSPQAASEFLYRAGIDGVKYPVDSYGKTVKDGDKAGWNYVAFSDEHIRVDHKWTDGEIRYMRNADGVIVGEYDAAKGEIRLYPGATVADVVHEFTHPLMDYARAEADAGRGEFMGKIKQIIDAERATWEKPVRDAYAGKGEGEILEEIFAHAMGEKGERLFGKSINTLEGRRWYNRLWDAVKGVWQDFATKMGWNKADLRGLERMSPEDAAQKILSEMAKGRNFGDAPASAVPTAESSVRRSRGDAPQPAGGIMDEKERIFEKWTRNFSDRFAPIKSLQESARKNALPGADVPDPYYEKRVQPGRNEADRRAIDMIADEYRRFLRDSKGKVTHEDMSRYVKVRDALYRNPDMQKRLGVVNGAGISDAKARAWLDGFQTDGKTPTLEKGYAIIQKLKSDFGLQRLVDGGMLDQETAKMLEDRNPDYAPQRTDWSDENGGFDRNSTRSMESPALKKALGRSSEADDPITFLFMQAKDNAARTNENRTRQEMAKLVRMFPEIGKVRTQNKTKAHDYKTGGDAYVDDPMDREDKNPLLVSFRENGRKMYIEFADTERGRMVAEAMRGEGVVRSPEQFAAFTRAWASTATQLSGTFTGRNFLKDTIEVALNSATDTGLKGGVGFLKNQTADMPGVVSTIREYLNKGTFGGKFGRELEMFVKEGGEIGGIGREGYQDVNADLSRQQKSFAGKFALGGAKEKASLVSEAVFGRIKGANEVVELLSRFNNFRNRLARAGANPSRQAVKDAVLASREDSTDFNMYGRQRWLNDVYMFSNSILGGTLRSAKLLAKNPKRGAALAGSLLAYGFVEAMADALFNDDDDKKAARTGTGGDKDLSERERSQTLFFRSGGKYFRLPMHAGPFSALKYTGGNIARAMLGKISWKDAAAYTAKEWATLGTHLGGVGEVDFTNGPKGVVESLTPSVIRPIVELAANQDFAGKRIYRPEGFDTTKPKSESAFQSTGAGYVAFARLLNRIGGGNEHRRGWEWLDNPPEAYKHIVEAVGKNMWRDVSGAADLVEKGVKSVATGRNEFDRNDIPGLRDVTRNVPDNTHRYYDALEKYKADKAELKGTQDVARARELRRGKPYLFAGKSLLDGQINQVKELMHLERGEIKYGKKWVKPKTPVSEERKKRYHDEKLQMQARILKTLGS